MTLRGFLDNLLIYGLEAFGKYYSSYRGYVVDNEDPENLNRVLVRVPSVTGNNTHPKWAFPKNSFSGTGYGSQVLPRKGDLVWVEFDNGNARFPMWSHGHFTRDEKPEEFGSINIYGFKTPEGHIILLDDDGGKILIKSTNLIQLNDGENEGLVKVVELTEKLNAIEDKVNDFIQHYQGHFVIDPISGTAGPLMAAPPAPMPLINTQQSEIENTKVIH